MCIPCWALMGNQVHALYSHQVEERGMGQVQKRYHEQQLWRLLQLPLQAKDDDIIK